MNLRCLFGIHKWKPLELKDTGVSGGVVWRNARECVRCGRLEWEPWLRSGFIEHHGGEWERREKEPK